MAEEDNPLNEGLDFIEESLNLIQDLVNRLDALSNEDYVGALLLRLDVLKRMFVALNVENLLVDDYLKNTKTTAIRPKNGKLSEIIFVVFKYFPFS
jgi:hypothetical protein